MSKFEIAFRFVAATFFALILCGLYEPSCYDCPDWVVKNYWYECENIAVQQIFDHLDCHDACCSDIKCSNGYVCGTSEDPIGFSRSRSGCLNNREGRDIECGSVSSFVMGTSSSWGHCKFKCLYVPWGCECDTGQLPTSSATCDVTTPRP